MTQSNLVQRAFSSGEISPTLHFRPDYLRYQTGLRACRGFLPMVEGGITRGPGTVFRGYARGDAKPRLIAFQFAANDAVVLEFTPGWMRVWRYGEPVLKDGVPYEIATPFDADSLARLSWVQSADVIYMADGERPVQRLARYALDDWTIGPASFTGPFMVQNLDEEKTLVASATTGTVTLTAQADIFESSHVGVSFHIKAQHYSDIPLWTGNTDMDVGQLVRYDGKIYRLVKKVSTEAEADYSVSPLSLMGLFARTSTAKINTGVNPPLHDAGTQQTSIDPAVWWEYVSTDAGIVTITAVTDARTATATVDKALPPNVVTDQTYRWSEGAWSDLRGWPAVLEIHEQRLVAAGTESEPRTVWFSVIGDYSDFSPGVEADDAFAYAVAGQASLNRIVGLKSGRLALHVFALGQEFSTRADAQAQYLSATTTVFRVDSAHGALAGAVIAPDGDPIFISRDQRRVVQISYSFQDDANRAVDLSRAAQHLGGDAFAEIAWKSSPQRMGWLRRESGDLVAMLFDPQEDVIGWAVMPVAGGAVASMAVTPGSTAEFDVLTLAVARADGLGVLRYCIEELSDVHAFLAGASGPFEANHLFSAYRVATSQAQATFKIAHLAGQQVYAWTNGGEFGPLEVDDLGYVTLPKAATTGFIGLFDDSHYAETLDIQAASPAGDMTGKKRRLKGGCGASVLRTAQGYLRAVERDVGEAERVGERKAIIPLPISSDLSEHYSGVVNVEVICGLARSISLRIEPHGAAPLTITGLAPKVEVTG